MDSLFIIGNGFDCVHELKTKYEDFKNFLISKSDTINSDSTKNTNDIIKLIIQTIDECTEPNWKNLEECLGNEFIDTIIYSNEWSYSITDIDEENIFHSVYENENISLLLINAYKILNSLFEEWVFNQLSSIDFKDVKKLKNTPSFNNSLFLSFNYTLTLENLYHISSENICHIHGKANNSTSHIYFGHGDDEEIEEIVQYIGISDAFNDLKKSLRKKTYQAINENKYFFKKLTTIKNIYSYGFSFSDVDMVYLDEICSHITTNKVTFFFNEYDWTNNKEFINKIKTLGFHVKKTDEWG